MPQRPEAPRLKPEYVFARSSRRLAGVRATSRPVFHGKSVNAPGASLLEFIPPEPSAIDFLFNSRGWQHINNFFNSKGLDHDTAKKYRRTELSRAKLNAEAATLRFVNGRVSSLEHQRDTGGPRQGLLFETKKAFLGVHLLARAVMSENPPIKTFWAVRIVNRYNQPSALSVLTTNAETAAAGNPSREPEQQRVTEMTMLDPAIIATRSLVPYAQPHNVTDRTALYQTVETAFAMLGIAASTNNLETNPEAAVVPSKLLVKP